MTTHHFDPPRFYWHANGDRIHHEEGPDGQQNAWVMFGTNFGTDGAGNRIVRIEKIRNNPRGNGQIAECTMLIVDATFEKWNEICGREVFDIEKERADRADEHRKQPDGWSDYLLGTALGHGSAPVDQPDEAHT